MPGWVGREQVPFFQREGDELVIASAEQVHPGFSEKLGRAKLVWKRAG